MKRVTVKYRVIQYSSRPDPGQARADASAPRTSGSQAAAHDPRAARPRTAPDVQEETNRCRAGDGDHAGGRESLQYPEPRRRSGNAPSVPRDQALRARTCGEHRGGDDPFRSDCEREPVLFEPHADRPLLRVPQGDGGYRSPLHGVFSVAAEAVGPEGSAGRPNLFQGSDFRLDHRSHEVFDAGLSLPAEDSFRLARVSPKDEHHRGPEALAARTT